MNANEGIKMSNPFGILESCVANAPRRRRRRRRHLARSTTSSQSGAASQQQASQSAENVLARKALEALQGDNQNEGQKSITVAHSKKPTNGETPSQGSDDVAKTLECPKIHQEKVASPADDPSPSHEGVSQEDGQQQSTNPQSKMITELEHAAEKWELTSPEGLHQIILWIQLLKDSTADNNDEKIEDNGSFYQAFVKSRVLEIIIRSILEQDYELDVESRKEILLLFDVCLLGSSSDHEWLYRTLRTVSTTAKSSSHREELFQLILTIIQSIKKQNPGCIDSTEETSLLGLSSSLVAHKEEKENFDSLKNRATKLGSVLVALEQSSGLIPMDSQSEQDILSEWRLALHIVNKKSESVASSVEEDCQTFAKKKAVLERELEGKTSAERAQLDYLCLNIDCLKKRRSELQEQRHRLMEQLQFVKDSLVETESLLENDEQLMSKLQGSINSQSAALKEELNEVAAAIKTSREDKVAVEFVQAFARGLNHRLLQHHGVVVEGHNHAQEHAACLENYLVAKNCLVKFLDNRIKYCQRRMLAASEETKQFESLGIHRTGMSALEEQMRTAVESDQITMRQAIADVQQHIARAIPALKSQTVSLFQSVADLMQENNFSGHFYTKPFIERYCGLGGALRLATVNPIQESETTCHTTLTDLTSDLSSSAGNNISCTSQPSSIPPSASIPASEGPPSISCFVHAQREADAGSQVSVPLTKASYSSVAASDKPMQPRRLKPPIRRSVNQYFTASDRED